MRWIRPTFKALLICFLILVVLTIFPFAALFQIPWYLMFGWAHFILDNAARIQLNPVLAIEAIACLVILSVGTHFFARWLHAQMSKKSNPVWPWRWTLAGVAIMLLLFVAGIGTIGVTHQIAWLVNAKEPFLRSDSPRAQMSEAILSAWACRTAITELTPSVSQLPAAGSWGCEPSASSAPVSKYVTAVKTNAAGEIQVVTQNMRWGISDGTALILKPWSDAANTVPLKAGAQVLGWTCGQDPANKIDLAELLPESCRAVIQSDGGFKAAP